MMGDHDREKVREGRAGDGMSAPGLGLVTLGWANMVSLMTRRSTCHTMGKHGVVN